MEGKKGNLEFKNFQFHCSTSVRFTSNKLDAAMSIPIQCFHSAQALQKFWESAHFMLSTLTTAQTRFLLLFKRNEINISSFATSVIPSFAKNLLQNMNLSYLVTLVT